MGEEKTILQQIREKELLLNIQIEDSRREAAEILANARKEAAGMVETSEREGETAAKKYYEREMERLKAETDQLRAEGLRQTTMAREVGERNLLKAIEKIVKSVSME